MMNVTIPPSDIKSSKIIICPCPQGLYPGNETWADLNPPKLLQLVKGPASEPKPHNDVFSFFDLGLPMVLAQAACLPH